MSYFGDIFRVGNERWRPLLAAALLIALCGGGLPWYAARYDGPAGTESKPKTAPLKLLGYDGTLTVTCECPPYLIARKARYLTFHYSVQLKAPVSAANTPQDSNFVGIYIQATKASLEGAEQSRSIGTGSDLLARLQGEGTASVHVTPEGDTDSSGVIVNFTHFRPGGAIFEVPTHVDFSFPVRESFLQVLRPFLYFLLVFLIALVLLYSMVRKYRDLRDREQQRLEAAQKKANDNPDQAGAAWDLASVNLQHYFTRNLAQVKQVFYVSLSVMTAGFACVLYGVYVQVTSAQLHPDHIIPATWVAAISGLITQFIGATFMVIYKSTMAQANEFVVVLDRINTVKIAMTVLDQMPNDAECKDLTRQQLISLLLGSHSKPVADHTGKLVRKRTHTASSREPASILDEPEH